MWKKIEPNTGRGNFAKRATRKRPAVRRWRGSNKATLIIPAGYSVGDRCTVYSDGNGRLAFSFGATGDYTVKIAGPNSKAKAVTIPAGYAKRINYGTTDVDLTVDGGMLVLDLSQLTHSASVTGQRQYA